MQRAVLAVVCLALSVSCPGSRRSTSVPVSTPPGDFSGSWDVQLVLVQDECGFCVSGTPLDQEGLKIDQVQDSVNASLTGQFLKADGTGVISGSIMTISFAPEIYESDWYFVSSNGELNCSLSGDTMKGAIFVTLGELGACCGMCCQRSQCLCLPKSCRVNLPNCKISFTFTAARIMS